MERELKFEQLYGPDVGPAIDGTPVAIPAGFKKPETMEERLKRFIRREMSDAAVRQGAESFDEANDFELPDDPVDPATPFEEFFDPVLGRAITPRELELYESQYRDRYLKTQADKMAIEDREEAFREALRKARNPGGGAPQKPGAPPPGDTPKGA